MRIRAHTTRSALIRPSYARRSAHEITLDRLGWGWHACTTRAMDIDRLDREDINGKHTGDVRGLLGMTLEVKNQLGQTDSDRLGISGITP